MYNIGTIYFLSNERSIIAAKCCSITLRNGATTYHFWDVVNKRTVKLTVDK